MLSPGPKMTLTSMVTASSASAVPISSPNFSSQLFAIVAAVGKQVAGRLAFNPRWSPAPAWRLNPWGPSDIAMDGIPYFSKSTVSHVFLPDIISAFSSRDICFMISPYFKLIFRSPVLLVLTDFIYCVIDTKMYVIWIATIKNKTHAAIIFC